MNSLSLYYLKRLQSFFLVFILFEMIDVSVLELCGATAEWDEWRSIIFFTGETLASFAFCIIPFLLYLAALPTDLHGGRADRIVTQVIFGVFCIIHGLEELGEVLSRDTFSVLSRAMIQNPKAGVHQLLELPGLGVGLVIGAALTLLSFLYFRRYLTTSAPVPTAPKRHLFCLLTLGAGFILLFATSGMEPQGAPSYVFDDGMISLFGGIFALTAVPNMTLIFFPPCLGSIIVLGLFGLADACCARVLGAERSPLNIMRRQYAALCSRFGAYNVALVAILIATIVLRLSSLGLYPLMDTTEARYGEMARKMVETGQWLQPQFDYGVPFWGKPPLSFWASAVGMKVFGINEFGARIAPFVCTLLIALCMAAWRFRDHARQQATAAAVVFLTCAIGYVSAGSVMTDAYLTLGVTLAMVAFRRAMAVDCGNRRLYGYLFFLGLAIGLLSKGPLTLVLCGAPIFLWMLWKRNPREIWDNLPWLSGTAMMLVLVLPWYAAAECATPGFLRYFIVGEHIERFLVKGWEGDLYGSGHSRAFGTIWLYGVEMFLPWVILLPFVLRRGLGRFRRQGGEVSFLLLWGLVPMVFFTPARNILPAYVLPAVPAWCLLLVQVLWARSEETPVYRHLILCPAPALGIAMLFLFGSGFDFIPFRCDRDLLADVAPDKTIYYMHDKPNYSAVFYTAGRAKGYFGNPEDLPPGTLMVTHDHQPSPGEHWAECKRSSREILWQKL